MICHENKYRRKNQPKTTLFETIPFDFFQRPTLFALMLIENK